MTIKIGTQSFPNFEAAVKWVMKKKGWKHDRAAGYVATIERKEEQLRKQKETQS